MKNEFDFFAVMEQTTNSDEKSKIININEKNGVISYLKFRSCMQTFGKRNRNNRLWLSKYVKIALQAEHIVEMLRKRNMTGESGHPFTTSGILSMARLMTIDPNNISHLILNFQWEGEKLYSDLETIADIDGPGVKLAMNIMQNIDPAFSLRSVVPQRKNMDGSIDVLGPGRIITYDRVFCPSHDEAYMDKSIPVKQITSTSEYDQVMESVCNYIIDSSDNIKSLIEMNNNDIALESSLIEKNGMFSISNKDGDRFYLRPEKNILNSISDYMKIL